MKEVLHQNQELRQQQRLTPMQVQFVRMLEMTGPEIEMEVKRAVEEMPALEIADNAVDNPDETDNSFSESADDMTLADYRDEDDIPSYRLEAHNRSADDPRYEPTAVNDEQSMIESLASQLSEHDLSAEDHEIALHIIGNLDDNGYLKRNPEEIADDMAINQGLDVSADSVRKVLATVRNLDPAGIAAFDLRDCLLLQLRRMDASPQVRIATEIIGDYFDLFSKMHFNRIAETLSLSKEELKSAVELIRQLNPKPASQLNETAIEKSARQIVPEFQVDVDGNELTLTLLNNIPDLTIEQTFADGAPLPDMPSRRRADTMTFIKARRDEAQSFIKTLSMRQQTLYRVMSAIVRIQRDFFMTGDETKLRPMILKDIAALTGYDLSVISRATASKYVMTPSGVYPLKFFFNERPKVDDDASYHQIAAAMRKIIDNEDKNSPLPDETITSMLNAEGFNIARRTIAKYRERMGYPVARLRKTI